MGNTHSASTPVGATPIHVPSRSRSDSGSTTFTTPTRRSSRIARKEPISLRSNSSTSSQQFTSVNVPRRQKDLSSLGSAESSDEDVMATQPARRRRANQTSKNDDPFIVEDDEIEVISSEDEIRPQSRSTKQKRATDDFLADDDEVEFMSSDVDSVNGPSPSKTRKLSKQQNTPKTPKRRSRKEEEELAEDLLDLQDAEPQEDTGRSRTRGGPVQTQRDKDRGHFKLLKKRRAGQRVPRTVDSDEGGEFEDGYNGVDIDQVGWEDNAIQVVSDDSTPPPDDDIQQRYILDEDDDFVVEDQPSTGRLGRPNNDIPLQFTSLASAKPRELFVHIIEWMVKNKISPAFDRNDEVYNLSFARVNDQVKAQAGSRLISSAWGATFKWVILARPGIHMVALPGLDEDLIRTCDACNRSNHPARYDFTFSGRAYSKDTLEPIDDSDDEDEDDDNHDRVGYDEHGHVLASEKTHFYLGRFCAANAEMGHKLTHWKHHLNEQVLSYLEEQGVLGPEAIVNREKLNKKKREKEAESIVDMMQETGMIDELWQAFQDDLEDARTGMEGHERRGGRGKQRIGSVRVHKEDGTVGDWVEGGRFRQVPQRDSDSEGER